MCSGRCPLAAQVDRKTAAMPDSPGKSESIPFVMIASGLAGLRERCRQSHLEGGAADLERAGGAAGDVTDHDRRDARAGPVIVVPQPEVDLVERLR